MRARLRSIRCHSLFFSAALGACSGDASGLPADAGPVEAGAPSGDAGAPRDAAAGRDATLDVADASPVPVVDAGGGDAGASDSGARCEGEDGSGSLEVTAVQITGPDGAAPEKGRAIRVSVDVQYAGSRGARVRLTPRITSARFSDYSDVPLGSVEGVLCPGQNTVELTAGPFLSDAARHKEYALGSGAYRVSSVTLERAGGEQGGDPVRDEAFDGAEFRVATSAALLVPVIYDAGYFSAITDLRTDSPEAYLREAFTRPNQVFTPSGADPDGAGSYADYAGGFDEMMGVRQLFKAFPGFPGEATSDEGWCEDAALYAERTLGMALKWGAQPAGTRPERHGFDYLLALTPDMGGGVACGWLDVQVSSLINRDRDRQQVVSVHETGHIFGAPHCDDVGNGSGGSLQGYVMCSGEKHAHYPDSFVWHATSRAQMRSHWD